MKNTRPECDSINKHPADTFLSRSASSLSQRRGGGGGGGETAHIPCCVSFSPSFHSIVSIVLVDLGTMVKNTRI